VATEAALAKTKASAKTLEEQLGYVDKGWRFVAENAKKAWDAMLGLGRQDSFEKQLENVRDQLAKSMTAQGSARSDTHPFQSESPMVQPFVGLTSAGHDHSLRFDLHPPTRRP
jgi:phage-related minor tail protein